MRYKIAWHPMTAGSLLVTGPCELVGIIATGGSGAAVCSVYDALTQTGTPIVVKAAINDSVAAMPSVPVPLSVGLYATVSGTGATGYAIVKQPF